jgi:hypothetical protein
VGESSQLLNPTTGSTVIQRFFSDVEDFSVESGSCADRIRAISLTDSLRRQTNRCIISVLATSD